MLLESLYEVELSQIIFCLQFRGETVLLVAKQDNGSNHYTKTKMPRLHNYGEYIRSNLRQKSLISRQGQEIAI